jgi:hypothetical protein
LFDEYKESNANLSKQVKDLKAQTPSSSGIMTFGFATKKLEAEGTKREGLETGQSILRL